MTLVTTTKSGYGFSISMRWQTSNKGPQKASHQIPEAGMSFDRSRREVHLKGGVNLNFRVRSSPRPESSRPRPQASNQSAARSPRSPATSPAQYPAATRGTVGPSIVRAVPPPRLPTARARLKPKNGTRRKQAMAGIQAEFDTAVETARHALEQFNAEPLVASKRGGPRLTRGSGCGSRRPRSRNAGIGSCRRGRSRTWTKRSIASWGRERTSTQGASYRRAGPRPRPTLVFDRNWTVVGQDPPGEPASVLTRQSRSIRRRTANSPAFVKNAAGTRRHFPRYTIP